jgi:hypothetical protein
MPASVLLGFKTILRVVAIDRQGAEERLGLEIGLPSAGSVGRRVGVGWEMDFGWFGAAAGGIHEGEFGGDLDSAVCGGIWRLGGCKGRWRVCSGEVLDESQVGDASVEIGKKLVVGDCA